MQPYRLVRKSLPMLPMRAINVHLFDGGYVQATLRRANVREYVIATGTFPRPQMHCCEKSGRG